VLGSASPALLRQTAETLAGRIIYHELGGFWLEEVGTEHRGRLWIRGGLPRSFLARTSAESIEWRREFIRTFLERDLPQLGISIPAMTLRRFWTMLAHSHGQVWNASELGRAMGMSDKTVKTYLDDLSQTYMVRQLQPWFENLGKRQVKSPKIYLRDSGLLHHLLGLNTDEELAGHPKAGASWEGFALEQILRISRVRDAYFWATQSGAELDLLVLHGGQRIGYEFKYSERPTVTRSMRVACEDLHLDHLWVICPGNARAKLDANIEVCGINVAPEVMMS